MIYIYTPTAVHPSLAERWRKLVRVRTGLQDPAEESGDGDEEEASEQKGPHVQTMNDESAQHLFKCNEIFSPV